MMDDALKIIYWRKSFSSCVCICTGRSLITCRFSARVPPVCNCARRPFFFVPLSDNIGASAARRHLKSEDEM